VRFTNFSSLKWLSSARSLTTYHFLPGMGESGTWVGSPVALSINTLRGGEMGAIVLVGVG